MGLLCSCGLLILAQAAWPASYACMRHGAWGTTVASVPYNGTSHVQQGYGSAQAVECHLVLPSAAWLVCIRELLALAGGML